MEKISQEFPSPIVREGGLNACLMFLDFFATHVQRTALSTAANCCRRIPRDSFSKVQEIAPTLINVLDNPDSQVAEKACVCVCEIVNSFSHNVEQLEQFVTPELLRKLLSSIDPNGSLSASHSIRAKTLRVLSVVAAKSDSLAGILVREDVASVIFQVLTHQAPPTQTNHTSAAHYEHETKRDNTAIIQALIHANKDLMTTSLNIITNIFPPVAADSDDKTVGPYRQPVDLQTVETRKAELQQNSAEKDNLLVAFCRTASSLMFDIFSASIDNGLRQQILGAFFRISSALDSEILVQVIDDEEMAALVSSIFTQGELPSLMAGSLEICKVLLVKVPDIYRSRFYRLGVIKEITEIANRDPPESFVSDVQKETDGSDDHDDVADEDDEEDIEHEHEDYDGADENIDSSGDEEEKKDRSIGGSDPEKVRYLVFQSNLDHYLIQEAIQVLDIFNAVGTEDFAKEAEESLQFLRGIASNFDQRGPNLQKSLQDFSNALHHVSSFELARSGILESLLGLLVQKPEDGDDENTKEYRKQVLSVLMHDDQAFGPFEMLIEKLHEALSRSEKFEIATSGLWGENVSHARMLAGHLRVHVVADDEEQVPESFKSIVLSIHAIAAFKSMADFMTNKIMVVESGLTASRMAREVFASLRGFRNSLGLQLGDGEGQQRGDGDDQEHDEFDEEGLNDDQEHNDEETADEIMNDVDVSIDSEGDHDSAPRNAEQSNETPPVESKAENESKQNDSEDDDPEEDWHLQFFLDDESISLDSTIYGAIYKQLEKKEKEQKGEQANRAFVRNIWGSSHTIKYKKVKGKRPESDSTQQPISALTTTGPEAEDVNPLENTPLSFGNDHTTSVVLRLLCILFTLNSNLEEILGPSYKSQGVSSAKFLSSKLTAKLNRQLDEPLIVVSGVLPLWTIDITRLYPFLFPFETRFAFLQSTSFGYSRSMARWQQQQQQNQQQNNNHNRLAMGLPVRQKVRVSRKNMLHSAVKVMEQCGSSPNILEIEYFDEVGSGLGPTLEFYSTVSKEFASRKFKLWRDDEEGSTATDGYIFSKQGLFPAPLSQSKLKSSSGKKILKLFKTLGTFVARAIIDSRIIDLNLNPLFFRIAAGSQKNWAISPNIATIYAIDPQLAKSLESLRKYAAEGNSEIEDLALDFTLPGYPSFELIPNGSSVNVDLSNVEEYIRLVIDMTLGSGVVEQIEEFKSGFYEVFPYSALHAFTPEELVVFCGQGEEDWSYETIYEILKADHGYNKDSESVQQLVQVLTEFSSKQRRAFLQFITGSPNLPIGGFKALSPVFTVVKRQPDAGSGLQPDDYLPSVMTCANYLKLPNYSSRELLKERLIQAMEEGAGAFLLS